MLAFRVLVALCCRGLIERLPLVLDAQSPNVHVLQCTRIRRLSESTEPDQNIAGYDASVWRSGRRGNPAQFCLCNDGFGGANCEVEDAGAFTSKEAPTTVSPVLATSEASTEAASATCEPQPTVVSVATRTLQTAPCYYGSLFFVVSGGRVVHSGGGCCEREKRSSSFCLHSSSAPGEDANAGDAKAEAE